MHTFFKKILSGLTLMATVGVFTSGSVQATPLGNLNDGLEHTSGSTGFWSLFVNAGDNVVITARRLEPRDIWAFAQNGADGGGNTIAWGDDELSPYVGGSFGDPLFSFTALTTGEYSIGVFECCTGSDVFGGSSASTQFAYFVSAQGATGNAIPIPSTLLLVGLGLGVLSFSRRKAT